jgi:light-regulated signal transduction histidine kinase (bacteriophytochrome)
VPYCDEQGRIIGVLGIFEDITQRKQAEEEIRSWNESLERRVRERTAQLEATNRELESFSYSISHDLRAPLRAIHGFARILTDEYRQQLDDQGRRVLDVVCTEAQRMGRLIDDLLNFCRLGKCAIQPSQVDMEGMVREVYCELRTGAADRQVELRLHGLPGAAADPVLVRQVWTNLLDNALKYTRPQPCARVEIGGSTNDGESLYFIRDNGIGLDMKYADKLFNVFQRLHGPDEFEGNGVGLALVQRIVQLHNGRVWVEAEPDRGATFYFTLPQRGHGSAKR